ncbi:MAG TPA: hypothetical protein VNC21_03520 [Vicinamibacterales bacterium]|nr:hypothetical protein [Vicinamibacterales bacterium]
MSLEPELELEDEPLSLELVDDDELVEPPSVLLLLPSPDVLSPDFSPDADLELDPVSDVVFFA